jgi:hypothetical protein
MTVFAWAALVVFTAATAALLVLLGRALFHALDRVDRAREDVWTMAKTLDSISLRLERIEVHLGEGDNRMEGFRDELRSTMRRDLREIVDRDAASRPRS